MVPEVQDEEYPRETDCDCLVECGVEGDNVHDMFFEGDNGSHANDKGGTHGDGEEEAFAQWDARAIEGADDEESLDDELLKHLGRLTRSHGGNLRIH